MTQRESRLVYGLTLLALLVLLYFAASPILLAAAALLAALWALMGIALTVDAKRLSVRCECPEAAQVGRRVELRFRIDRDGLLPATRCVFVELQLHNALTGEDSVRQICLRLWGSGTAYSMDLESEDCGELIIRCGRAWIQDHLELFHRNIAGFDPVRMTVYPRSVSLEVLLDQKSTGFPWADGPMQNRMGSDASETFDIREYRPGDDVRLIHWKLSGKADDLIVRLPGSPVLYDLVVLADFGIQGAEGPTPARQRNAALAYGCAALGQMADSGIRCCLALQGAEGIQLLEIGGQKDYANAMAVWMGTPLPQKNGDALRLFQSEHLDSSFSRMLLLNTGKLTAEQQLTGICLSVTVLSAAAGGSGKTAELGSVRVTELPDTPEQNVTYRIQC